VSKPVLNVNLDDDAPLYPNELLQPAPISCPCLPTTTGETSDENNTDLETIINRNDSDTFSTNDDGKIYNSLNFIRK